MVKDGMIWSDWHEWCYGYGYVMMTIVYEKWNDLLMGMGEFDNEW